MPLTTALELGLKIFSSPNGKKGANITAKFGEKLDFLKKDAN
ncbi:hypothetical protein [Mucilaginibacter corticis]|nr:hypothetical protein [Mucilaginibacter corticis]